MYDRWMCLERCLQHVFGHDNQNAMQIYVAGEEYLFPTACRKKVPQNLFDLIEKEGDDEPDAPPEDIPELKRTPLSDDESRPVETLFRFNDKLKAGLNALGIRTIGDLRVWMSDGEKIADMLESDQVRVGPGLVRKFKMYLGIKEGVEE